MTDRPDFSMFDVDLEEGFEDAYFEPFPSAIEAAALTEQAARYYSPRAVTVSDSDAAEMEAVYHGLVAHYFSDHPTVQ